MLVSVAALAGCGGSSAGTLQGRVVVKASKAPVPHTRLTLLPLGSTKGEARRLTTNANGGFTLTDVEKGSYRVSFTFNVSGVFSCTLRYPVEILAGKTVVKRLPVPVIDIKPDGTATLPDGRTTTCRTLKDPFRSWLCEAAKFPIDLWVLPPSGATWTGSQYGPGKKIWKKACESLTVRGRLHVKPSGSGPLGWILVSLQGKQRWINPTLQTRLPAQLRAWQDVALSREAKLPSRAPTLAGLPDLAFTTPVPTHFPGEPCYEEGPIDVQWDVAVQNKGAGLTPKQFDLEIENGSQTEIRHFGSATWIRGLAPKESLEIKPLAAYVHLRLDPGNKVKESDESNNDLTLGSLPQLTCTMSG